MRRVYLRCRYARRIIGGGALLRCELPAGHTGPHTATDAHGTTWTTG